MWGFFKKLVIADRVAVLVNTVFDNYQDYVGVYVIAGIVGYSIQLYGDFSGGMDISQGVSQIFGIKLIENFERPYFSLNMNEFWQRWHVSLGRWCRDYIFYPITLSPSFGKMTKRARKIFGDRVGKLTPIIVAQFASFMIIGIWHGAQFKYLAYGFYQAFFINLGLLLTPQLRSLERILHINTDAWSWKLFLMVRTFILITIGRFFDRASRFRVSIHMMKAALVFNPGELFNGGMLTLGLMPRDFQLIAVCLLIWLGVSIAQEKGYVIRDVIGRQNIVFRWMIYLLGLSAILIFGHYGIGYDANTFIYRTF
jgi:D-alanyl-lipoteichoic acid acyltransferase DltB (MBOAT superfamily)